MDDKQFRVIAAVAASGLFLVLFQLRFCGAEKLPPVPPVPEVTQRDVEQVQKTMSASPEVYVNQLVEDSALVGIDPPVTPKDLGAVLPHSVDRTARVLSPGESIESVGLELSLRVQEIEPGREQMVLQIHNRTGDYLAYRVVTEPTRGTAPCGRKRAIRHNGMALAPRRTATRSECLYREGWKLEVKSVETVALGELSYHYVSGLPPAQISGDPRVAEGHRPPRKLRGCPDLITPIGVTRALERGDLGWRDLVDFYARHSCARYRFLQDYRAFERPNQTPLPVTSTRP